MQALTRQMKIGSSVCCCAGSVPAVLPRAGAVLHALWRQDPGPHPRLLQKWPRLQCGSLDAAGRCSVPNRGPHGSRSRPVNPGAFAGSTRAVLRVRPADQTPRVRKRESLPSTRFLRCPPPVLSGARPSSSLPSARVPVPRSTGGSIRRARLGRPVSLPWGSSRGHLGMSLASDPGVKGRAPFTKSPEHRSR